MQQNPALPITTHSFQNPSAGDSSFQSFVSDGLRECHVQFWFVFWFSLEVKPPFFIVWFTNHHYFSRGLSSSKEPPIFFYGGSLPGIPPKKIKSNSICPWNQDWMCERKIGGPQKTKNEINKLNLGDGFNIFLFFFVHPYLGK